MKRFPSYLAVFFAFFFSFLAVPAFAVIDVAAAVTAITTDAGGAVTAIGVAMLGLAALAVAFKWAKAAIFG